MPDVTPPIPSTPSASGKWTLGLTPRRSFAQCHHCAGSVSYQSPSMSMCPPTGDKPNSPPATDLACRQTLEHVIDPPHHQSEHRQPCRQRQNIFAAAINCDILLNAGVESTAENCNVALNVGQSLRVLGNPWQKPMLSFSGVITARETDVLTAPSLKRIAALVPCNFTYPR